MSSSYCVVSFRVGSSLDCIGKDKRRLQLNSSWTCNTDSDWEEKSNCSFPSSCSHCMILLYCSCVPLVFLDSRCPLLLYLLLLLLFSYSSLALLLLFTVCFFRSGAKKRSCLTSQETPSSPSSSLFCLTVCLCLFSFRFCLSHF